MSQRCQFCDEPTPKDRLDQNCDQQHCSDQCEKDDKAQKDALKTIDEAIDSALDANKTLNDQQLTNEIKELGNIRSVVAQPNPGTRSSQNYQRQLQIATNAAGTLVKLTTALFEDYLDE